jgi:hypothetical protein
MTEEEQPTPAEPAASRAVEPTEDLVGKAGEFERGIHLVHDVSAPPDEMPPTAAIAAPAPQALVPDDPPPAPPPAGDSAD